MRLSKIQTSLIRIFDGTIGFKGSTFFQVGETDQAVRMRRLNLRCTHLSYWTLSNSVGTNNTITLARENIESLSYDRSVHLPNTDLSDLRIMGTSDILVYQMRH